MENLIQRFHGKPIILIPQIRNKLILKYQIKVLKAIANQCGEMNEFELAISFEEFALQLQDKIRELAY